MEKIKVDCSIVKSFVLDRDKAKKEYQESGIDEELVPFKAWLYLKLMDDTYPEWVEYNDIDFKYIEFLDEDC